jgi:cyclophilin family peptidyl-prolyl cis-trans isomerase
MRNRVGITLAFCLVASAPALAQVIRFETSLGHFDMVLNPTENPLLEAHAENMVRYVEDNRYTSVWINRAAEDFVLQMGGFYSHTKRPPLTIESTRPVRPFAPVDGEPASTINGLSNTVGTVALALPGDGMGGTNQDAGTSSFFVNLASNTFLDEDFTVFAAIPDMTVINEIMALMQIDRTTDPMFGADAGNLGFTDVPIQDSGFQVFIDRAFVLTDTLAIARARAGAESTMELSAANFAGGPEVPLAAEASVVPEPATGMMLAAGVFSIAAIVRRRRLA